MSEFCGARCRFFVRAVVCAFWILCASTVAADQILRYAEFGPNRGMREPLQRWLADEIHRRSQGQLVLRTSFGGSLIGARNVLRGVAAGVADLGTIVAAYTPAQFERYRVTDLPVGDDDPWVGLRAAYDLATGEPEIVEEFRREGVLYLSNLSSTTLILACRFPVTEVEDFQGLRMRAVPPHDQVFRSLGAVVVGLPIPEVYQALDRGLIDCTQTYWLSVLAYRHFEPAPELTELHWSQNLAYSMIMSRQTFDDLAPRHQASIRRLGEDAIDHVARLTVEEQQRARTAALQQPAVTVHQLAENARQHLREGGEKLVDAYPGNRRLFERYKTRVQAYRKILDASGYPWER